MSNEQNPYQQPTDPEKQKWGAGIHFAALIGLLLPLGLVLGPLLVWMLKKHDNPYFDIEGKKAINFQLTVLVSAFVIVLISLLIRPVISIAFMIGLAGIIFAIMAGVMTYQGKSYNYPFSFTFIK